MPELHDFENHAQGWSTVKYLDGNMATYDQIQGDMTGCRTGNGEKLSSSQAEPGQAITSDVA